MSGRVNGPSSWRKTAYRAAMDLAEGRVSFDPDAAEYLAFTEQNESANLTHVVSGSPELDDDCLICRKLREQYGAPEILPMADGSTVEVWGPGQSRGAT